MTSCQCNYCRFGRCANCQHPEPTIAGPDFMGTFRPTAYCQCRRSWTCGTDPIVPGIPAHRPMSMNKSRDWYDGAAEALEEVTTAESIFEARIVENAPLCPVISIYDIHERLDQYRAQLAAMPTQEREDAIEAARDARIKREGAAEALEDIAKDAGVGGGKAYFAEVVYREFPDRLTTKVGVVEAADIMDRAVQLRASAGTR